MAEAYCVGIDKSSDQRLFLSTLAFLKFHVVESNATWWNDGFGLEIVDEEPVFEISRKIQEIQESIRNPDKEKSEESQQDESLPEESGKE